MDITESSRDAATRTADYAEGVAKGGATRRMGAVTLGVGLVAFLFSGGSPLGAALWSPSPNIAPTGVQGPLLLLLTVLESLSFGFGVALLAFGWPALRRTLGGADGWGRAAFGSLVWLFLSPWIHDDLHVHYGHGLDAIIALNYLFHWGLVPLVAVILAALLRPSRPRDRSL